MMPQITNLSLCKLKKYISLYPNEYTCRCTLLRTQQKDIEKAKEILKKIEK
jgi:hypothetical protein